jgi:hypothetical protein
MGTKLGQDQGTKHKIKAWKTNKNMISHYCNNMIIQSHLNNPLWMRT